MRENPVPSGNQHGSPTELYDRPANLFVADFIGNPRMSFLDATVVSVADGSIRIASPAFATPQTLPAPAGRTLGEGSSVTLGVRPEALRIDPANPAISAKVEITENLGGSTLIHARTVDGRALTMASTERTAIREGDVIPLAMGSAPHLFDEAGRRLSNA